jgi:hypothetical protein
MDLALGVRARERRSGLGPPSEGPLLALRSSAQKGSIHEMQVLEGKSAKRNDRVPRREGGLGYIEMAILIPLVLAANTVVGTIAW